MLKILIVDDNKQITSILKEYANKNEYEAIVAFDGFDALKKFEMEKPDILLLDVMMPGFDGFEVCKKIRKVSNVPIIMITARGEDYDRIMGLEIGADDYIVKPFSPGEVMARIKAIMRRINPKENTDNIFQYGNLKMNIDTYEAFINNKIISLTKKEFEILWTLGTNKNTVFSRDKLLDSVWGYDYFGDNRTVDSHIKRLRSKIDKYDYCKWTIKTIWGVGYKFEVVDDVQK